MSVYYELYLSKTHANVGSFGTCIMDTPFIDKVVKEWKFTTKGAIMSRIIICTDHINIKIHFSLEATRSKSSDKLQQMVIMYSAVPNRSPLYVFFSQNITT